MRLIALTCVALAAIAAGGARAADSGSIVGKVTASPLSVQVIRPADPLREGRWFRVVAEVTNAGSTRLDRVGVTLVRPAGLLLRGSPTQTIARIPARASRRADWQVCSNTPGSYVVLARAQAGSFTAESPGAVIQILSSNRTC